MTEIRTFLDLSTAHLPPDVCDRLDTLPGVIAYQTVFGWLLHVPDDLDTQPAGDRPAPAVPELAFQPEPDVAADGEPGGVPEAVLAIQRYARAAGCHYVLLDADADRIDALPTWDW